MDLERFRHSPVGRLVPVRVLDGAAVYDHEAFVPSPLPSQIDLQQRTWSGVLGASAALARLDGAARRLPNPYLLVRPALTKEAVSSSALEGTYAAIEDVYRRISSPTLTSRPRRRKCGTMFGPPSSAWNSSRSYRFAYASSTLCTTASCKGLGETIPPPVSSGHARTGSVHGAALRSRSLSLYRRHREKNLPAASTSGRPG